MDLEDLELRPSPVPVRVVPLQRRTTSEPLVVEGRFAASRAVLVKSPSSGLVEGLDLSLGDAVERGQRLCTIGASMARQRALSTEATIHQLEAQLAEREDAKMAAEARNEPAHRIASFEAKVRVADKKLAHERVQRERQEILLQNLDVRAPFSARVASVHAAPGGAVMSGNALFELVEVDPIVLVLQVPTWVASRCRPGDPVQVRADSDPEPRRGQIGRWAPTASDGVRRLLVDVPNPDGRLAAGESGAAQLEVGERTAYFAPRAALHEEDKTFSLRVVEHHKVRVRAVRVLGGDEREVEVTGALTSSHLVVLHAERPLEEATEVVIRGDH